MPTPRSIISPQRFMQVEPPAWRYKKAGVVNVGINWNMLSQGSRGRGGRAVGRKALLLLLLLLQASAWREGYWGTER